MKLGNIKRAIKIAHKHYNTYWAKGQKTYFELARVEYDYEGCETEKEAPFVTVYFTWGNETQNMYFESKVVIYEWCNTPERLAAYMMGVAQEVEMKGE